MLYRPVHRFTRRAATRAGLACTVAACAVLAAPTIAAAQSAGHRSHHRTAHGYGYASPTSCRGGVCFANDPFYRFRGQCTWYAAGRRPDLDGIVWGNAGNWLREAHGHVPEGSTPVVGAVAVWLPYHGGAYGAGHVAYVAAVSGSSVTVEDFNWGTPSESFHRHSVPASWISGYIYGGPAGSGAPSPPPPPPSDAPPPPPPATTSPSPPSSPPPPPPPPPPSLPPTFYVHHVTGTCRDGSCGLRERSGSGYSSYAEMGVLGEGAEVDVVCQALGEMVSNGYASSAIWDKLTNGYWVTDFYVDTPNVGTWSLPIPQC